jgi:hypothetical protein
MFQSWAGRRNIDLQHLARKKFMYAWGYSSWYLSVHGLRNVETLLDKRVTRTLAQHTQQVARINVIKSGNSSGGDDGGDKMPPYPSSETDSLCFFIVESIIPMLILV